MKINSLTTTEEQLMQVLWKLDTFYSKEILESHPDPKPHQNTVSTYLKILVEKEFLKTEKEGRIFKYSVIVPQDVYKKFLLQNLIENHFDQSAKNLIGLMVEEKILKSSDINSFFDIKTTVVPTYEPEQKTSEIGEYILELTKPKKKKKDKKKKKNKKKKK